MYSAVIDAQMVSELKVCELNASYTLQMCLIKIASCMYLHDFRRVSQKKLYVANTHDLHIIEKTLGLTEQFVKYISNKK